MTNESLDGHAGPKVEHGETAVEALDTHQLSVAELLRGRVQEPGVIGLSGSMEWDGVGHVQECSLARTLGNATISLHVFHYLRWCNIAALTKAISAR